MVAVIQQHTQRERKPWLWMERGERGERKAARGRRRKEGGERKAAKGKKAEGKEAEGAVAVIQQQTQREKEGRRWKGREGK